MSHVLRRRPGSGGVGGARARSSVECPLGGVSSGSKAAPKPCPSPTTRASLLPVFLQTLAMRGPVPGSALRATVSGPSPPLAAPMAQRCCEVATARPFTGETSQRSCFVHTAEQAPPLELTFPDQDRGRSRKGLLRSPRTHSRVCANHSHPLWRESLVTQAPLLQRRRELCGPGQPVSR